jgi:Sulfotransferase family
LEKPKVIYVMGQGKSGSTILGVTLGNCTDVVFAGELSGWLMGSGERSSKMSERERFWQSVRGDIHGDSEVFGKEPFRELERSLSVFRPDRWLARRRLRGGYRRVTQNLYRSIANRAQATHVVDTSHLPMRARELQRMRDIDLYLIFLVRDVEGVAGSYMRVARDSTAIGRRWRFFAVNARLWITYLLSTVVFLHQRRDRRMLVRHERFIADPEGVLREILDAANVPADLPDLTSLSTGIALKGNRLIRSETVALNQRPAPPHRRSRLMRMAQGPWGMILRRLQPAATGASERRPPRRSMPIAGAAP